MAETKISGIFARVFDAYGILFDVHFAAEKCHGDLSDKADQVSNTWRQAKHSISLIWRTPPFARN